MKHAHRLAIGGSIVALAVASAGGIAVSASGGTFSTSWSPASPTASTPVTLTASISGCGSGNTYVPSLYYMVSGTAASYNDYFSGVTLINSGDEAEASVDLGDIPAGSYSVYAYGRGTPCFASASNFTDSSTTTLVVAASVPGAPTAVTPTANIDGSVGLSWTAPSDGGSTITSYTVVPSPACSGCGGLTVSGSPAGTAATVTGLTLGTAYTFTVSATNAVGTGAASTASGSVTPEVATVPGAPTGVTATANTDGSVGLSWTAPSDGGSTITSYTVVPSPACSGCGGLTVSGSPAGTAATVTGLTLGTAYTFTVSAANAVGSGAASTASGSVTPAEPPAQVAAPTAVAESNGTVTVSWTAPADNGAGISGYTIASSPSCATCSGLSVTGAPPATGSTVGGLTLGTAYTFTVSATNAVGTGPASAASAAVTAAVTPVSTPPGAAAGVSAVGGSGSATVSWTAPSDNGAVITSYTVTASPGGATCTWAAGPLTCTVSGLSDGVSYTFTVTATNAAGTGPASSPSSAVTPNVPALHLSLSAAAQADPLAGPVTISGTGLEPGSTVTIVLHSTPVTLASVTVAASGDVTEAVTLPASTPAGAHTIIATGTAAGGTPVSASMAISVTASQAASTAAPTPVTGAHQSSPLLPLGAALVLAGLAVLLGVSGLRRVLSRREPSAG